MELQDINISSPPPIEGPLNDEVIDTELSKTAKLEIEPVKDGLLRGEPASRSGRFSTRQYVVAACVSFGLITLVVAISLATSSNRARSASFGGRSPKDDITKSFVCLATISNCPANATQDWTQVSHDIVGESGGDLAGFSVSMSCDGSIMAIGAPRNRYVIIKFHVPFRLWLLISHGE